MRRILYYSLLCLLWVSVNSCSDEEASQPPTPSYTVTPKAGLMAETDFVFEIDQVAAGTISLLPYGLENPNDAGIIIPASSFTNGKATYKFKYGRVGTFNPVVVANNHSTDGSVIKNSYSPGQAVVITNDETSITEFSFDGSTKTTIDGDNSTITVELPWDKAQSINAAKAKFGLSPFASAKVGSTVQASGETANNFGTVLPNGTVTATPVVYTVTSQNGAETQDWTVTVVVKPIQTTNTVKSAAGAVADKGNIGGSVKAGRGLPGYVDNTAHTITLYDVSGAAVADYDSVQLDLALDGDLSYAKFKTSNKKLKGKDTVNLDNPLLITITPQDSTNKAGIGMNAGRLDYTVRLTDAPKLTLVEFGDLNPVVTASQGDNFNIGLNVLDKTDVAHIATWLTIAPPAGGGTITATKIGGATYNPGGDVDYTKPVKVEVTVDKGSYTFVATYTLTVTVLK